MYLTMDEIKEWWWMEWWWMGIHDKVLSFKLNNYNERW